MASVRGVEEKEVKQGAGFLVVKDSLGKKITVMRFPDNIEDINFRDDLPYKVVTHMQGKVVSLTSFEVGSRSSFFGPILSKDYRIASASEEFKNVEHNIKILKNSWYFYQEGKDSLSVLGNKRTSTFPIKLKEDLNPQKSSIYNDSKNLTQLLCVSKDNLQVYLYNIEEYSKCKSASSVFESKLSIDAIVGFPGLRDHPVAIATGAQIKICILMGGSLFDYKELNLKEESLFSEFLEERVKLKEDKMQLFSTDKGLLISYYQGILSIFDANQGFVKLFEHDFPELTDLKLSMKENHLCAVHNKEVHIIKLDPFKHHQIVLDKPVSLVNLDYQDKVIVASGNELREYSTVNTFIADYSVDNSQRKTCVIL